MTELDVALTDYLLGIETAGFALLLYRRQTGSHVIRYFMLAFASLALAAFLGGTSHGFFNTTDAALSFFWWWATLLAVGLTAAGFGLAGHAMLTRRPRPAVVAVSAGLFMAYAVVTFLQPEYVIAILFYLPALLVCLAGFIVQAQRKPGRGAGFGITGILLSLLAALLQQAGLRLHPIYFTHNAVYHLLMMLALWLVFLGARALPENIANQKGIR